MKRLIRKPKSAMTSYALSYMAYFVLLLLVMGGFIYSQFSHAAREQYERNGADEVAAIASAHRVQWNLMQNTANQMMFSDTFLPFAYEDRPLAAMKLMKRLQNDTAVSNCYTGVLFSYRIDHHIYSGNTSCNMDFALSKGLFFENTSKAEIEDILLHAQDHQILPMQRVSGILVQEDRYMSYVFPLRNHKNAVMVFFVPQRRTKEYLNVGQNEWLWCYDSNGRLLYGSDRIPNESMPEILSEEQDMLTYRGVDYMHFDYTDDMLGVTYHLVKPISTLRDAMKASARSVLLFSVTLSIPALLLIAFSSIRFGKKVRRIRRIVAPQGAADNFESIENAAQQLAKRITLLDSVLDENALMKRNKLIRRLVQDGANDDVVEEAKAIGWDLNGGVFAVMLVGLRHDQRENIIQDLCQQMDNRVWGIELTLNKQILFLLCEPSEEAINSDVQKMEKAIRSVQKASVIAVSTARHSGTEIPLAFLEAQSAFDKRFLEDTGFLLRFDASISKTGLDYPEKYIDALKYAIRIKDQERANNALAELIQYTKSQRLSMTGFRLMYNSIIHVLISECSEHTFQQNIALIYNVFSLSQCLSIDELNGMLSDLCTQLINHDDPHANVSTQMHQVAEYIRGNYHDSNISMGGIAKELQISAVAFSLGFKEAIGMSPSQYLTMTRMEQAKHRLIETDATVQDIGLAVGYFDLQAFLRKFKAYTSMTPTQYRNNMRSKQQGTEADA